MARYLPARSALRALLCGALALYGATSPSASTLTSASSAPAAASTCVRWSDLAAWLAHAPGFVGFEEMEALLAAARGVGYCGSGAGTLAVSSWHSSAAPVHTLAIRLSLPTGGCMQQEALRREGEPLNIPSDLAAHLARVAPYPGGALSVAFEPASATPAGCVREMMLTQHPAGADLASAAGAALGRILFELLQEPIAPTPSHLSMALDLSSRADSTDVTRGAAWARNPANTGLPGLMGAEVSAQAALKSEGWNSRVTVLVSHDSCLPAAAVSAPLSAWESSTEGALHHFVAINEAVVTSAALSIAPDGCLDTLALTFEPRTRARGPHK